jgi:hypothetical protein
MKIRKWFAETVFLKNKHRFCEFLLECPSTEVSGGKGEEEREFGGRVEERERRRGSLGGGGGS